MWNKKKKKKPVCVILSENPDQIVRFHPKLPVQAVVVVVVKDYVMGHCGSGMYNKAFLAWLHTFLLFNMVLCFGQ